MRSFHIQRIPTWVRRTGLWGKQHSLTMLLAYRYHLFAWWSYRRKCIAQQQIDPLSCRKPCRLLPLCWETFLLHTWCIRYWSALSCHHICSWAHSRQPSYWLGIKCNWIALNRSTECYLCKMRHWSLSQPLVPPLWLRAKSMIESHFSAQSL
jgi:hypothetical protein